MSYNNHFTGEITITPPLPWAEVQDGPRLRDLKLRITEARTVSADGNSETVVRTCDAVTPLDEPYSGHKLVEDLQWIVDHYGAAGHTFAGHIQVQWDPGFGETVPERYVVVDGRVETVTPRLVWPGEVDGLIDDARKVALTCKDILDQMPVTASDFFEDDWDQMPDWFTGEDNGREIWGGA